MSLKKVGALWCQSKEGNEYYSGTLDLGALGVARIFVFKNDRKEGKQPDATLNIQLGEKTTAKPLKKSGPKIH